MQLDSLNFDYNDKKKVYDTIELIQSEIDSFIENPIIRYRTRKEMRDPLDNLPDNIAKIIKQNKINIKTPEKHVLKAEEGILNPPGRITNLQQELKIIEKHLKPTNPQTEFFGFKKFSESTAEEKKYDDLAKRNGLLAKQYLEDVENYIKFILVVLSDINEERKNVNIFTEQTQERLNKKIKDLDTQIEKLLIMSENLEDIRYKLSKMKQEFFYFRGLQEDEPDKIINEYSINYDILFAKSLIEKFKQKLTRNEKVQTICDACETRHTLQTDAEIITNVLSELYAQRNNEHNNANRLLSNKVGNFIQKMHDGALLTPGISMHYFVNSAKMKNIYSSFFGFNNYSLDEKISRLEILNLTIISTQQELQDYLTAGNKEIEITKTADGKLKITVGHKLSYEEEMKIKESGTTSEKSFLKNKNEITYVYDSYKKELESVIYKDNASIYELDINSELGKNVKNQFTTFVAAIESSLNIEQKSLLGFRISLPQNLNLLFKGTGIKNKLEIKGKNNITTKIEVNATAGELGWTKRRGPKAKLIDVSGKTAAETDITSLEFKINTYIDEGLDLKTKTIFNNLVLSLQKDKISAAIGTQLNPIAGLEYNKNDNLLTQKSFLQEFIDGTKGIKDALAALFYARVLNDKTKMAEILNVTDPNDANILDIFKKCIEYSKQIKYAKKDAETYIEEDNIKKFQSQQTKKGKVVENVINKIGKPKDKKIEKFNSDSQIKGAEKLSTKDLEEKNIKTIHDELYKIIDTKVLAEDVPKIREFLLKVPNPLIYIDKINQIQTETDDTRKSVTNIFNKVSEDYILKLINGNDFNKLKEILKDSKYKMLVLNAFKKAKPNVLGYSLSQLKDVKSETLDEVIKANSSIAKKFIETPDNKKIR